MSSQNPMSVERAARIKIGRQGSILERDRSSAEAVIEDLSTSGCFVRGDFAVAIGSVLAIGVPGIGTQAAKVMRLTAHGAGCAFLMPLSEADIQAARTAEEMELAAGAEPKRGGFIQMKDSIRSAANAAEGQPQDSKPLTSRLARAVGVLRKPR